MEKRIELCENVVSVDYICGTTLHYFTYATSWTDTEHIVEFKTLDQAIEWYEKNMRPRCIAQGKYWLEEGGDLSPNISDEDAIAEWREIVECVAYE